MINDKEVIRFINENEQFKDIVDKYSDYVNIELFLKELCQRMMILDILKDRKIIDRKIDEVLKEHLRGNIEKEKNIYYVEESAKVLDIYKKIKTLPTNNDVNREFRNKLINNPLDILCLASLSKNRNIDNELKEFLIINYLVEDYIKKELNIIKNKYNLKLDEKVILKATKDSLIKISDGEINLLINIKKFSNSYDEIDETLNCILIDYIKYNKVLLPVDINMIYRMILYSEEIADFPEFYIEFKSNVSFALLISSIISKQIDYSKTNNEICLQIINKAKYFADYERIKKDSIKKQKERERIERINKAVIITATTAVVAGTLFKIGSSVLFPTSKIIDNITPEYDDERIKVMDTFTFNRVFRDTKNRFNYILDNYGYDYTDVAFYHTYSLIDSNRLMQMDKLMKECSIKNSNDIAISFYFIGNNSYLGYIYSTLCRFEVIEKNQEYEDVIKRYENIDISSNKNRYNLLSSEDKKTISKMLDEYKEFMNKLEKDLASKEYYGGKSR